MAPGISVLSVLSILLLPLFEPCCQAVGTAPCSAPLTLLRRYVLSKAWRSALSISFVSMWCFSYTCVGFRLANGRGTRPFSPTSNHLKIRFTFIAYRRATCATETPGPRVCWQIERFSSSVQRRCLRGRAMKKCSKVSTINGGHYPHPPDHGRWGSPDAYARFDSLGDPLRHEER